MHLGWCNYCDIVAKTKRADFMSGLGALPARFRRARLLIVGCGDVGQRVAKLRNGAHGAHGAHGPQLLALTSSPHKAPALRALGIKPLLGNLDDAHSLGRLSGVATHVLHLAPPPGDSAGTDPRTWGLLRALARRGGLRKLVYGSTSGVYGHCEGAWVDEVCATRPQTERARRRVSAEQAVRGFARSFGVAQTVLRIPGIYAPDREGGTPKARLERQAPVLQADQDVYTNHIHATDLARACWVAVWGRANYRTVNVSDDSEMLMGDYMDMAAALYQLPKPKRVSLEQAQAVLSPMQLSFMRESRRLRNTRMKRELRLQLRYPTIDKGLQS
jgi:nucleoside-diphosphate-sugar epimerase